ncbi:MAG: TauD/TfdA family dioxygenase [Gammaproteobacteria bacterium]|jgi:taurine dioxygenase
MNSSGSTPGELDFGELEGSSFGVLLEFDEPDIDAIVARCAADAEGLRSRFHAAGGLMIIRGLQDIRQQPGALLELSRLFGPEVENYRETLTSPRFFHDSVDEILILTNAPPCNHPPPPRMYGDDGNSSTLRVQFPHRVNWHTDQSYRRPPPDITLLLALDVPPPEQGRTLYADCTAAFAALDADRQHYLQNLEGIHAPSWVGRSRAAVENGEPVLELLPHQRPQRHPLVRRHPVTGKPALYICEEKQMDYVDGPVAGLEPGPRGEGAALVRELLAHATREEFVYAHEWRPGDLLIGDNRNLLHCATWYDADRYTRLMWRTTVMGNPGDEYAGEGKSWIPRDGSAVMAGMDHA